MSHSQLAKLYLRGSLMNKTATNLTDEQKKIVEDTMEEIWNDPELQGHKFAFCTALYGTIRNEYLDREKAEQEARIAIWKACVSVLFHDKKIEANERERIISDKQQRAKYFKTWIMNYLRQILRENRRPAIKSLPETAGFSCYVAYKVIESFILFKDENIGEIVESDGNFVIYGIDQRTWPLSLSIDIQKLADLYKEFGVKVVSSVDKIEIISTRKTQPQIVGRLIKSIRVKEASLDYAKPGEQEDGLRYVIEWKLFQNSEKEPEYRTVDERETLDVVRERLPEGVVPVFDLLVNTPPEFVSVYGDKPKKNQVAKFLGKTTREVDEAYSVIRSHYSVVGAPNG